MFNWGIKSITFSGGETVELEPSAILLLVGPNNGGKTSSLGGIQGQIYMSTNPKYVVQAVEIFCDGSEKEFTEWLRQHYESRETVDDTHYLTIQGNLRSQNIASSWKRLSSRNGVGEVDRFLICKLDTETRLQIGNPSQSQDHSEIALNSYIHVLQANERIHARVSREMRNAFGVDLIINWGGGSRVWLNVGNEPPRTREQDRVSPEYLRALNKLPRLEHEGDGIRSFAGTILATLCGAYKILFIDEPEAFLHPPQARKLASIIAESAESQQRQIIIATHSSEIIHGILDITPKATICRLTREGNVNHADILSPQNLKSLWSHPLLNSVSAIDGIFYDGTVVCEADTDCRFYNAIIQRSAPKQPLGRQPYFYLLHGGGKGSLAYLAKTYRLLNVPVAVIADFDLLRNKNELINVVTALGGSFDPIESFYNTSIAALNNIPPTKSFQNFVSEAQNIINHISQQGSIGTADRKTLEQLLDDTKGWSEAKKYGITKLTGGAHQACQILLEKCAGIGLFIVPSGALETWWRGGPSDKGEWAKAALGELAQNPSLFREATDFISGVCNYLLHAQQR